MRAFPIGNKTMINVLHAKRCVAMIVPLLKIAHESRAILNRGKRPDIPSGEGSRCGMNIGSWFILGM